MTETAEQREPTAQPARLRWQAATVVRITAETPRAKTFTFQLPDWRPFHPGMHYDVRLTAPDGYQAQRSYSIASAPEVEGTVDLTVELIEDGEVSPYFHEVLAPGDQVELRGPIGGPFTWRGEMGGPLLLIAGGSGIVPIMSMLRHRAISAPEVSAVLLCSARSPEDVIYRDELERMAEASESLQLVYTFTRRQPGGWNGFARRVDQAMLADISSRLVSVGRAYVCGPTPFVETAASGLVENGVSAEIIRTERFGPTGG